MSAAGYIIPQVVDPASYRCIRVYVPNDTLYLAAFWNAYEYFAKWAAWERDTAHRAKDAAAVWRIGYDMARDEWEAGEDCDMAHFQLRQNPDDPCQLQQSFDGGETWSLAFDYRLCSEAVTLPPPYPGSDTGSEDAAAEVLRDIWIGILDIVDDSPDKPTFIGNATTEMRLYDPDWSNPAALGDIWDTWISLNITQQEAYKDECTYTVMFDEMKSCFDPEGALDYLDCWTDMITEWLTDASDTLITLLNQVAYTLSGNGVQAAAGGGAGGGAGFGTGCGTDPLSQCYEFTTDDFAFTPAAGDEGVWVNAFGWQAELNAAGTMYILDISRTGGFPTGIIDEMKIDWEPTGGSKRTQVWVNGVLRADIVGGSAGFRTSTFPVGTIASTVRIRLEQNTLNSSLRAIRLCFYRT